MDTLDVQLFAAARRGETRRVRVCLAAGADANVQTSGGLVPLHAAAHFGHTECAAALVAGGAYVNVSDNAGRTPLLMAATQIDANLVRLLLAAGADPLAAMPVTGWTPLHHAAEAGHTDMTLLLLQAGPSAALARDAVHNIPLTMAIRYAHYGTAHWLLRQGPVPPARDVLAALANAQHLTSTDAWAWPLYATLVTRQPLTPEEWWRVPTCCHGLGAALPAVVRRSAQEAAQLVRHLPAADRQHLRAASLCLWHAQRRAKVDLPSPIVGFILALLFA